MTNDEFREFMRQLQASFPSLYEWLAGLECSRETQGVWRTALQRYSLVEVSSVIQRWSTGQLGAFAWYDRDKVHLLIRAVIEGDRSRAAKAAEHEESQAYWQGEGRRRRQNGGFSEGLARTVSRAGMDVAKAFAELRGHHARLLAGELSAADYSHVKTAVLDRYLTEPDVAPVAEWVG